MRPTLPLLILTFFLLSGPGVTAQISRKALFLGNSYTGVNNLPQLIRDVALSAGDTLIFDNYNPGGYQLSDHAVDPVATGKLTSGGWDYVVLQEQSQRPITNTSKFRNAGFALDSYTTQYSFCGVTMLYMTWGRKNGDPTNCLSFPVMCTYEGMDSTLRNNYLELASDMRAEVSPVSVVWNYLRNNQPGIELYQPDESHPSAAGSYAAACCFYAAIFKKDPTLITYNFGLAVADAAFIKIAAKKMVFDQLHLWDLKQSPTSYFWYQTGAGINEARFIHTNLAEAYSWDFGDGATSALRAPAHSYAADGTYTVSLTTSNCDLQGLHSSTYDTTVTFCSHTPTIYTSNSWMCQQDSLWTQAADTYQWLSYGKPIPETGQYLPHPTLYGSDFSVIATENGCSELSQNFSFMPEQSGYYFDIWPGLDPCEGDTVPFAVLHFNGFLSGDEVIRWYKDGVLLPQLNDEDTLWITTEGTYECKVVDPNSAHCPLDTTSYLYELDCEVAIGMEDNSQDVFWTIFPNPVQETLTIQFTRDIRQEQLQIYNAVGRLVKVTDVSTSARIDIADLPAGLYFIRLKGHEQAALKFIKQ